MAKFSEGEIVGSYVLKEKIGEGGWGEVWLARHPTLSNKAVAIKFLLHLREDMQERFKQEAVILDKLRENPHIITVEDIGEHRGISYFLMQYAPGGDLSDKIGSGMSPEVVGNYLKQIANALDFAHAQGIIHRDLKPSNILFDAAGSLLLSDFGIAHDGGKPLTDTNERLRTPEYCAPEQFKRAKDLSATVDIYALGAMTFQLLTGRLPFGGRPSKSIVALALEHLQSPVPPLSKYRMGLPSGLQVVIEKAMAKEASARYQSAKAFATAFEQVLVNEPPLLEDTEIITPPPIQEIKIITPPNESEQYGKYAEEFGNATAGFQAQLEYYEQAVNAVGESVLSKVFAVESRLVEEKLEKLENILRKCKALPRQSEIQGKVSKLEEIFIECKTDYEGINSLVNNRIRLDTRKQRASGLKERFKAAEEDYRKRLGTMTTQIEQGEEYLAELDKGVNTQLLRLSSSFKRTVESSILVVFEAIVEESGGEEDFGDMQRDYQELSKRYEEIQVRIKQVADRAEEVTARNKREKEQIGKAEELRLSMESVTAEMVKTLERFEGQIKSATGNATGLKEEYEREITGLSEGLKEAERRRGELAGLAQQGESIVVRSVLYEMLSSLEGGISRCRSSYERVAKLARERVEQQLRSEQAAAAQKQWAEEEWRLGEETAAQKQAVTAAMQEYRTAVEKPAGQAAGLEKIFRQKWERVTEGFTALGQLNTRCKELGKRVIEPGQKQRVNGLAEELERALSGYRQELAVLDGKAEAAVKVASEVTLLLEEIAMPSTTHARRAEIGDRLSAIGDTRKGVGVGKDGIPDIAWLAVTPGGKLDIKGTAFKRTAFEVQPFYIGQYQVTYAQYEAFVQARDGYQQWEWWQGYQPQKLYEQNQKGASNPRDSISWYQAVVYGRWLNKRMQGREFPNPSGSGSAMIIGKNAEVRLPTEWEWQWAAQGGQEARKYPWGAWQEGYANTDEAGLKRTMAVGLYPQGAAKCGAQDMSGNVWEWCLNKGEKPKEVAQDDSHDSRGMRGGDFSGNRADASCASRGYNIPYRDFSRVGFRLVVCSANAPL